MADLFFYGTLRHRPLLTRVLGHDRAALEPARLSDNAVFQAGDAPFPTIAPAPGREARGLLLRGADQTDIARLDFYEGGFDYDLRHVTVHTDAGSAQAQVYFPGPDAPAPAGPWSLEAWAADWAQVALDQAEEIMARFGRQNPEAVRPLMPVMRGRAWARRLAAEPAPATRRRVPAPGDVDVTVQGGGHEGFFRVRRFAVRHRRFDGDWSPTLQREAMISLDVALVLPYDPVSDRLVLVEQLRYGPLMRGDPVPFLLEAVAGFVEAGERPEDAARRETQEEAGLALHGLQKMTAGYASPGYSTEFYHYFLGLCTLDTATGRLAGAASEHEDIRTHVLRFDEAMALLDSGEVNAAPLATMLLWLARARPGLRGVA